MTEPTAADREQASRLWARCRDGDAVHLVDAVAAALAAAREEGYRMGAANELRQAADAIRHQLPGHIGRIDTADTLCDRADQLENNDT